jgi:hypothetical protein
VGTSTRFRFSSRTARTAALVIAAALLSCSDPSESSVSPYADGTGPDPAQEVDGPEPDEELPHYDVPSDTPLPLVITTVEQAVSGGCSTTSVKGLSEQIVAQMNCLVPAALAKLPDRPNLTMSAATFPYLQPKARDALVAALSANPGKSLALNSMLRTVAQQYLLYRWGQSKRCGVALAATPGKSNHESGLALDTSQYSEWRSALESRGFKWFGSADKVHFDYTGPGRQSLGGVDVKAFQMLWNANHPEDRITADGSYGPATAARLGKSPTGGFPIGPECGSPPTPPDDPGPGTPAVGRTLGVVWDLASGSSPTAPGARRIGSATISIQGGPTASVRPSDAYFEIELGAGSYTLVAAAPGYMSTTQSIQIVPGEDTWASTGLSPAAVAAGRIVGVVWNLGKTSSPTAAGAERIAGAIVSLQGGPSQTSRLGDGFWQLHVAPGSYTLSASAPGFATASKLVEVQSGQDSWSSMGLLPGP